MGEITRADFSFLSEDQNLRAFDVSSPEGLVQLNLYQLECLLNAGSHTAPIEVIKADIHAYQTILERNLCREYKNWRKDAINSGTKDRMPRHFVMERKIYANFD